ncbi:MAG: hypothetical protein AAFV93_19910 [Chloroflexota bacterium]
MNKKKKLSSVKYGKWFLASITPIILFGILVIWHINRTSSSTIHQVANYTEILAIENENYSFVVDKNTIQYQDGWYRDCFFNISGSIQPLNDLSVDIFTNVNLVVSVENNEIETDSEFFVPVTIEENRIFFNSGDGASEPISVWLEYEPSSEQLSPTIPINITDCRTIVSFKLVQVSNF